MVAKSIAVAIPATGKTNIATAIGVQVVEHGGATHLNQPPAVLRRFAPYWPPVVWPLWRRFCSSLVRASDQPGAVQSVARRRREVVVPQQHLDNPDIRTALEQMSRKTVAHRMPAHPLDQACRLGRGAAGRVKDCTSIGLAPRPGNSRSSGRASRQWVRKIPSS